MDVYLISRLIGTVRIDLTQQEQHDSTMRITDNPVESGAVVADHAVLEPRRLTVQGLMVDWAPAGVNYSLADSIIPRESADFLNLIALPVPLMTFTPQTLQQARRKLGPALSYVTPVIALDLQRALAPWLPDFQPVDTLDMSSGSRRVEQVFDALRAIQKSGEMVEIITGSQHYENMLVVAASMTQTRDGSAALSVTAQELFIVETQTVSGITVAGGGPTGPAAGAKSGRSDAQSSATRNKGNVQTPDAGTLKRSSLNALTGGWSL
ncbi:phage baseplate protein [Paraburkholderia sp. BR10936]|uniref:phage baseplate protein n=1 Tax=Paraburkholderia sp. BR10936 TaxID=3236993 RepID=UPI0034D31CE5